MTFYIRDPATDIAVRRLARIRGKTLTETVREAVENALRKEAHPGQTLAEQIRPIQERLAQYPRTGLDADKAFYDELSGDI